MSAKKRGLGRGLDALLGKTTTAPAPASATELPTAAVEAAVSPARHQDGELRDMPVEFIQRGKYQPRRDIEPQALEELAASIKAQGVIQPIVVRPIGPQKYEIIAGERRWRACQLAGLDKVPVLVRDIPDEAAIAWSLIENIQREDLNCMEEALAMDRLAREFSLTHQEVSEAVGKSRTTVTNLLRLMHLPNEVQRMLEHGDLEMGHARALLGLPKEDQARTAQQVVARGLSVRQTEALVRNLLAESGKKAPEAKVDPDIRRLVDDLAEKTGAPVDIQHSAKGKGKLVFKYSSLDELEGILRFFKD